MNTNFKVISLTLLGFKPESTAPEADALTPRPSELFIALLNFALNFTLTFFQTEQLLDALKGVLKINNKGNCYIFLNLCSFKFSITLKRTYFHHARNHVIILSIVKVTEKVSCECIDFE